MTEDSRVKRSLFQTNYTMFAILDTKSTWIRSYKYVIGGLLFISEIQIEGLSLKFDYLSGHDLRQD